MVYIYGNRMSVLLCVVALYRLLAVFPPRWQMRGRPERRPAPAGGICDFVVFPSAAGGGVVLVIGRDGASNEGGVWWVVACVCAPRCLWSLEANGFGEERPACVVQRLEAVVSKRGLSHSLSLSLFLSLSKNPWWAGNGKRRTPGRTIGATARVYRVL